MSGQYKKDQWRHVKMISQKMIDTYKCRLTAITEINISWGNNKYTNLQIREGMAWIDIEHL